MDPFTNILDLIVQLGIVQLGIEVVLLDCLLGGIEHGKG